MLLPRLMHNNVGEYNTGSAHRYIHATTPLFAAAAATQAMLPFRATPLLSVPLRFRHAAALRRRHAYADFSPAGCHDATLFTRLDAATCCRCRCLMLLC